MDRKTKNTGITHLTVGQYANQNGVSPQRIRQYLKENRVEGAIKITNHNNAPWLIPAETKLEKRSPGRKAEGIKLI
jgi:P pilus assembly chaperone PapD